MDSKQEKIQYYQQQIVKYWELHGRHYFHWRNTKNPWKLLTAEILLKKTTSQQAHKIYEIIKEYTPQQLIDIPTNELQAILHPLGISEVRATELKEAAEAVKNAKTADYKSDTFLRSIKGVGRYVSNSVRCTVFGEPVPALDTNMIRIISRVFDWKSERSRPREDKKLWEYAETLIPADKCREYNWGVLDFGAAVCTKKNPKCQNCPINTICNYYIKLSSSDT